MVNETGVVVIAAYGQGTASVADLRGKLAAAWRQILADPRQRGAAAGALGIPADTIAGAIEPPVCLETGQAGISGVEIAVVVSLWLGDRVLLGALEDMAKDEVKRRVQQLWTDVLEPAFRRQVRDRLGLGPTAKPT